MSDPGTPLPTGPIAWMADNPVASNLLMFLIFVGGVIAVLSVKQEVFPAFDLDIVSVSVPYPGASPAEVEQGIVLAIEEAVRGVDGVKKVTSTATEGVGSVKVETLLSADPDKVLADVKNEVDRIRTFPEEAEDPQVALVSRRSRVISLVISGDQPLSTLHGIGEKARAELLSRGGVTLIELEGVPPLEVAIEVDRATLASLGLTLDDISRQIAASSLELPGGAVETENGELLVRVADRRLDGSEFSDLILRAGPGGEEVRLGDIATVRDGYEDNDQATFYKGRPAVLVTAYRTGSETPTGVAGVVRDYSAELVGELPGEITVTVWDDDSELLRGRIDLLVRNAVFGLLLVLTILWLFLDLRLALWVALGIPLSFLGAFLMMPILGVSVNMISLFALIVTLGLVVDDAIVIGENIHEKTEKGMDLKTAAKVGASEMATPVTFAILTTVAAFSPMLFVPGVTGKIFSIIPIVVIAVLVFSLIESFFVLPAHLAHETPSVPVISTVLRWIDTPRIYVSRGLLWFTQNLYTPLLRTLLHYRYITLATAFAVFATTMAMPISGLLPFSFLPKTESDIIIVSARLPYGVPVEHTLAVRRELEAALNRAIEETHMVDGIKGVLASVGQGPPKGGAGAGPRAVGSNLLAIEVSLTDLDDRPLSTFEFSKAWQDEVPPLPGVDSLSFVSSIGPSAGAAVQVQLAHLDTEVLAAASEEVAAALRDYPDLINIDNGYAAGKPQLSFSLLPAGQTLGLTSNDIARQMRSSFHGSEAVREQRGRNEIKVMVRLPDHERNSEYDLEQLDIRTPRGGMVPLYSVAEVERGRAPTAITRETGRRVVDVKADMAPGVKTVQPILDDLSQGFLRDLTAKYPGLTARFAGEQESQNESLSSLASNGLLAMVVMYGLLAVPFGSYLQPLIIMSAIPFGLVGALGGHLLMGYELSVISLMGIIAVFGVVVNDSLVLIDAANRFRREEGLDHVEAIVAAGQRRMRPILLTSLTTFFGLLPMIFETSVQARFLIPMAISLGFGVLFTTVIALLVVPVLFVLIESTADRVSARLADTFFRQEEPKPVK